MTPSPQKLFDEDEAQTIDMEQFKKQKQLADESSDEEGTIDMEAYARSKEPEEASWWDVAKDIATQPVLGLAQAYTYPLDLLKLGMVGEGLSGVDELEEAYQKEGKPFDKQKYIKSVAQQAEYIPTQELLENVLEKKTGFNLTHPKSKPGKWLRKFFTLGGFLKGKGLEKAAKGAAVGATTKSALTAAGAPEILSDLTSDVAGFGASSLTKEARILAPKASKLQEVADKHGLPLMEGLLKNELPYGPKITQGRKKALERKLGTTSEEAINSIIEDKIPVAQLRKQGQDTKALEGLAYDHASSVAKNYPDEISLRSLGSDIDQEIARVKSLSPSPSDAKKAYIKVLESEKESLLSGKANAEQLIEQTRDYNSNVKSIYKKAEHSGVEEEVKNAYGFLNDRIRSTIEKEGASEVIAANRAANKLYAENVTLDRAEGTLMKAFNNGEYSPKKLHQVLNSKSGNMLRRDLGEQAVKDLRDIADFGTTAQKATTQFANSARHKNKIAEWGPLAGFLIAKLPTVGAAAIATKPFADYVRGWALTRPAARTVYRDIIKNASKGSFKSMTADFAKLEAQIIDEFGSMDEFVKQGINDLQFYEEGEEDKA